MLIMRNDLWFVINCLPVGSVGAFSRFIPKYVFSFKTSCVVSCAKTGAIKVNNKNVANVAPYFDGATFASRIKVPTMISVGYVDTTCSPSSVYAAFNNLKGEKVIFPMYRHGHSISPDAGKAMQSFLSRQLKK